MNILFISTRSPYPLISGHSMRTYHILKGAARDHNVTLATFVQLEVELERENLMHLESLCQAVYPVRIPSDVSKGKFVRMACRNLLSPLPFVAEKYDCPEMRQIIREVMSKNEIDLVHVDMLPLSVYVNEFEESPKIIVNHNVESIRLYRWAASEKNVVKKVYFFYQWSKLRSFEKKAINKFDCCVTVSDVDRNALEEIGVTSRLCVVENGTNVEYFTPMPERNREEIVLWFGHMDVHTNRDAALYFWRRICPILRRKRPEIVVAFVGTGPPKEIEEAAKTDDKVRVKGFVEDIRPDVMEASVVVVPIRIGSGTRVKILDAMAMGKAIVSTSVGCEGIPVTHGKDILVADEPEDFSARVLEVVENKQLKRKLEINARCLAMEYSWDRISERQAEVYEAAAGC